MRPQSSEWKQVVLSPEPDWVHYKGLWGVKSLMKDESGPPGPKWDRPDKLFAVYPRNAGINPWNGWQNSRSGLWRKAKRKFRSMLFLPTLHRPLARAAFPRFARV